MQMWEDFLFAIGEDSSVDHGGIAVVQHAAKSEPDCRDTLTAMVKGSTAVLDSWDDDHLTGCSKIDTTIHPGSTIYTKDCGYTWSWENWNAHIGAKRSSKLKQFGGVWNISMDRQTIFKSIFI